MSKKRKDEVTVKFISNSAVDVTGSAVLISYDDRDYLIEYGQSQGVGTVAQEYAMNLQYSKNLNIDKLKCVLISHQNIDHIALIPALVKRGFKGDIIGSYEALEFSKKLLEDCAFIIDKNVEYLNKKDSSIEELDEDKKEKAYTKNRKKQKKVEHIYKECDVAETCNQMRAYDIGVRHQFDEYMSYEFVPTNHLTGSCQIVVYIKKKNSHVVKIWYSGDLGSELAKEYGYFMKNTEIVPSANLGICECTYFGNMTEYTLQDAKLEREDMKKNIWNILHTNGKVLVPSFSMQRSQHMMMEIWNMFKDEKFDFDVIVDSRLTKRINNTFSKVLTGEDAELWEQCKNWRNFKFIENYKKETEPIMATRRPMVVISSSGMAQNGHIVEWIKSSIDCSRDMIMVVGYVPEDSILYKLMNIHKKGDTVNNKIFRCNIKKYNTFSSHLSAKGILRLLNQMNLGTVVFHHGSKEAKNNAIKYTKEMYTDIGKTTKVLSSCRDMEIKL